MKDPQRIIEYQEDIFDAENSVKAAEKELADAKEWLMKQKVYLAEAIIKLHHYSHDKS